MSRLTEIFENHQQLDQLQSVLKHHGISAEFMTQAAIEALEGQKEKQSGLQAEQVIEDLKQLMERY